jgi:solute carrier family 25 protein 34/35
MHCLLRTVQSEGVLALWKGSGAQFLRVGPHTTLTFLFWEQTKKVFDF